MKNIKMFQKYKSYFILILCFVYLSIYIFNNWNKSISIKENSQNILNEINHSRQTQSETVSDTVDIKNSNTENVVFDSKIYKMYEDKFKVTKVVDGDTIHVRKMLSNGSLENFTYKVRIMAANTLEKDSIDAKEKCFANMATDFTVKNLLNKNIYLYGDKTQPKLDQYDRTLAYVLEEKSNIFYNEILMNSGLAKTYKASPPATEWRKYENIRLEMEKQKKGIWDENLCKI
jgi:endonuclease YncB( thermonuclease family)